MARFAGHRCEYCGRLDPWRLTPCHCRTARNKNSRVPIPALLKEWLIAENARRA